jgi:hypothetical protein
MKAEIDDWRNAIREHIRATVDPHSMYFSANYENEQLAAFDALVKDAESWRAFLKEQASKIETCSAWAEDKTFWEDAKRYRKIKRISTKHGGIDIYEEPSLVNVFHSGIDKMKGQEAPTLDQAVDEVVE